jgi:hypothetical protein
MSDAAAAVAQQGYSAQAERIRTELLLAHYLLRISFPNLFTFSLSFYFLLFLLVPYLFFLYMGHWQWSVKCWFHIYCSATDKKYFTMDEYLFFL